jgi:drug/metabolite transporter (DMT)-like permease
MAGHENQKTNSKAWGSIEIAVSGIAFGFLGVFGKLAFRNGLSVGELLSYRFLAATLIMAFGLAVFSPRRLKVSMRDLAVCAGLGIFGYAVFSTFYFNAIKGVSVAMASLLLYTYPVLVAIGARIAYKQKLTRAQLIALPLALGGLCVLLSGDLASSHRIDSIASGLAAAVCYAGYILVSSRYQNEIEPLTSGFYVMLFASVGLFAFHRPNPLRLLELHHNQIVDLTFIIFAIAFICTVTPLVLFLSGLQKIGNTEASLLSTIEPVMAAVLGSVVLQETLSSHEWTGGVIVMTALVTTVLGSNSKMQPAEALE